MDSRLLKYISGVNNKLYFYAVNRDIIEASKYYPWINEIYVPTVVPTTRVYEVIAVNKKIIDLTKAEREDFTEDYSKKVYIIVPPDYPFCHCLIFGGQWIKEYKLQAEDVHFKELFDGIKFFCVGVPKSVLNFSNIILENLRTVENMLIAYELYQKGKSSRLELLAYSHGEEGKLEYERRFKWLDRIR